ncbi:hypothetical protein QJS10_CPB20g01843 [Acorus calamus]|uniref:Wall-associated receptor kinase galacturonan-binding domain-containing protein n=1 Tax=Acorus calamus TaxID=4465 RepID=A0AAV9CBG2_ACOCL|nr:hypothetical protein QJS10_CPB20g01843 [Acorus calamus]
MRNQEFLLLALLLSFGFFSIPSLARNQKQLCPPSSCGDIRDIHYPFRLKGDPIGCGDPYFELSCVGNQTVLFLLQNMEFYVKEINYTTGDLRIIDVGLANNKCSFPRNHLTTLQFQPDDRFCLSLEDIVSINFVFCSPVISDSEYLYVPCASNSNEKAYVNNGSLMRDLKSSCRFVASYPVKAYYNYYGLDFSSLAGVQRVLADGFNYKWSEKRQGCNVYGLLPECVFQCLKNATRSHFAVIFNKESVNDEFQCGSPCSFGFFKYGIIGLEHYFSVRLKDRCRAGLALRIALVTIIGVAHFLLDQFGLSPLARKAHRPRSGPGLGMFLKGQKRANNSEEGAFLRDCKNSANLRCKPVRRAF